MYRLLAIGTAGKWSVQIDSTAVDDAWGFTIDHPNLYVQSMIRNLEVIGQLSAALKSATPRSQEIRLGELFGANFTVLVSSRHIKFKLDKQRLDSDTGHPEMVEIVFDPSEGSQLLEALNGLTKELAQASK